MKHTRQITLRDLDATQKFAEDLALIVKDGDCFCLAGELGAGKTTLVRAVIRAIAGDPYLEVPSPTFTLVQQYELRVDIGHLDLYRASDIEEVFELGLDDILAQGAAFIEWPELIHDELPKDKISIAINGIEDEREIVISGSEEFIGRLDRTRKIRTFLDENGYRARSRHHLQGDASYRHYERLTAESADDLIFMNSPKITGSPILKDGKTYYDLAHLAQDIGPFINIGKYLRSIGLNVPKIYKFDINEGFLILEDLGNEKPIDDQNIPIAKRYMASIEALAHLHSRKIPAILDDCLIAPYSIPEYDADVMELEVSLLLDWYWQFKTGSEAGEGVSSRYYQIWRELISELASAETSLVLRDFHSPNIIWQPAKVGLEQVGLIDFQDAQIGPSAYDVASLALDARVVVAQELEQQLVAHYKSLRSSDIAFDPSAFDTFYSITAAQRLSKILGFCVRKQMRDQNPEYLRLIPQIEAYLWRVTQHRSLKPLRNWFEEAGIFETES